MRGTARICVHATSADLCKALSQLNDKIVDACGKEKLLNNMQGASGRCVGVAYVISVCTAASPVKSTLQCIIFLMRSRGVHKTYMICGWV